MEIMSDEKLKVENVRLSVMSSPLKKGYKQTDVGLIPTEWNVKTFAEIFKFLATGTNSRSDLSEYGDIKYVHYGDIHTKWFFFLDCTIDSIPLIDKSKVAALPILCDGDLIMADASEDEAGIGISVEVKHTKNQKVVAGLHTFLLRGDKALVADGFKAYIQCIKTVKNSLRKIATGVSVYGISKNNLRQVLVALPTLPEQQAISKTLIDVDALISKLDALISKKRNLKQGAMQQLLSGKKRLPGFADDWVEKKLGSLGNVIRGASPRPQGHPKYYGGAVPRLMVEDVTRDGKYVTPMVDFLTEEGAKRSRPCKAGTLTIVCSGTVGIPSFLAVDACIHDGFLALIDINQNICADYLFHQLVILQEKLERSATHGGIFTNLTTSILREFIIAVPSFSEQQAIAKILSDMDSEIKCIENQRKKIRLIKQGMMQELLTGKTRLL